jgi:hypothetical protein
MIKILDTSQKVLMSCDSIAQRAMLLAILWISERQMCKAYVAGLVQTKMHTIVVCGLFGLWSMTPYRDLPCLLREMSRAEYCAIGIDIYNIYTR